MLKKDKVKKVIIQFVKFGVIGILNTAISLGFYYLFLWINADMYIWGYTIGFFVSVLNAYFWNNRFVFNKTENGNLKPLIRTYIVYGSTYLLGTLLIVVMIEKIGVAKTIAPLINLLITIPLNFILNKFWAFK